MDIVEGKDRDCAALEGLFQQVVNKMKTCLPHYEDLISKADRLHGHLKHTTTALASFLESFQKLADSATDTQGATREIGAYLTRTVMRHKNVESRMKTLSSTLQDCLVLPMAEKMEEWRREAAQLDKEHSKENKRLRQDLKKKTDSQDRLLKKNNTKSVKDKSVYDVKVSQGLADVTKSVRCLQEVERVAVRRVLVEARSRLCTLVACLRPVLGEQVALVEELQPLGELSTKLAELTEEPWKLPPASEQVLSAIMGSEGASLPPSFRPPSPPYSLGSWISLSSAGSSGGASVHFPGSHGQAVGLGARQDQGPLAPICSQDSGFTSEDTLFLRAADPWGLQQGLPGLPMMDRPHTISSAYERGHQRPSLQTHTFSFPKEEGLHLETDTMDGHDRENVEEYLAEELGSSTSPAQDRTKLLPPPPPHLLYSDDEDCQLSVADSVRKLSLQQLQQAPVLHRTRN